MVKYKNNKINGLEFIKMFVLHFYLSNTKKKKKNGRIKKILCYLFYIFN